MVRNPSDIDGDPTFAEDLRRLPTHLYKFWGMSGAREGWVRRLIEKSELFFPSPKSFNDPMDCRVPPVFRASQLEMESYWRRVGMERFRGDKRARRLRVKELVGLPRTPEGRAVFADMLFESLATNGIACFTKGAENMLLWSYYAEGHTGVAIRFSMAKPIVPGNPFLPIEVQYCSAFPDTNFFRSTNAEFMRHVFGIKAQVWQHEAEWRFIMPRGVGYHAIPTTMIDEVILGARALPETETKIRSWIGKRPIRVSRMVNSSTAFALEIMPI